MISFPSKVPDHNIRWQIVALPYHLPCAKCSDDELRQYEKDCLEALNQKLLLATLWGTPFRAILLELILCGTGGELSNNFLRSFGALCEHYNVPIIVDEVMTGGRVGPNMTLASSTPIEFNNQVKFITMGKYNGCGMLLRSEEHTSELQSR